MPASSWNTHLARNPILQGALPPEDNPSFLGCPLVCPWDIGYFKQVIFKEIQDSKTLVILPLYMPKEIQIGEPASGREPELIHLSTYELCVARRRI